MGKVTIFEETTKNPITLIGQRAGCCWGSPIDDPEKNYKRGLECLDNNHGRTLEFPDIEMMLDGYSAKVIREWYTHIGGAPTRLQASTRYIDYKGFEVVEPPKVKDNEEADKIWSDCVENIRESMTKLLEIGMPKEDASMLLPLSMKTRIVDKRNLRNFIDMTRQRLCTRAYWEYRELMRDIIKALSEYSDEWKTICDRYFMPKCEVLGYCPERYGCGRKEKRK